MKPSEPRSEGLPLVIDVFADLGGQPAEGESAGADADSSQAVEVTLDTLDAFIASLAPARSFSAPNTMTGEGTQRIDLRLRSMQDFEPERVAARSPALQRLLESRAELIAFRDRLDQDPQARLEFEQTVHDLRGVDDVKEAEAITARIQARAVESARQREATERGTATGKGGGPAAGAGGRSGSVQVQASSQGVWSTRTSALSDVLDATPAPPRAAAGSSARRRLATDFEDSIARSMARNPGALEKGILSATAPYLAAMSDVISRQLDAFVLAEPFQSLQAAWRGLEQLLRATQHCPRVRVRVQAVSAGALRQLLGAAAQGGAGRVSANLLVVTHTFTPEEHGPALLELATYARSIPAPCLAGASAWRVAAEVAQRFEHTGQGPDLADGVTLVH